MFFVILGFCLLICVTCYFNFKCLITILKQFVYNSYQVDGKFLYSLFVKLLLQTIKQGIKNVCFRKNKKLMI